MAFQSDGGLAKARKAVEATLRDLGLDPAKNAIEPAPGGLAWHVARGSADVMIALNPASGGGSARLRLVSPVVRVDFDVKPAMLMRLLELNAAKLPGIAFGVLGDKVVLVAERSVRDLDRGEVEELLAAIGHYADKYDDELAREFGGARVCDTD